MADRLLRRKLGKHVVHNMKVCLRCNRANPDDAFWCNPCRHSEFTPKTTPAAPVESGPHKAISGPEFLTTERKGKLTILKCRTPGEAFLVAQELAAADILVVFPDDETLSKEFQRNGFVNISVSAQSYEAARELQTIIERKHWIERAQQPLSLQRFSWQLVEGSYRPLAVHGFHQSRPLIGLFCSVVNCFKVMNWTWPPTARMIAPFWCSRPTPSSLLGKLLASL